MALIPLTGRVHVVCAPQQGVSAQTGKAWVKQDVVLELDATNPQYPSRIVFSILGQDKINQYNLRVNDRITVHVSFSAREYNGRWYSSVTAISIEKQGYAAPQTPQGGYGGGYNPQTPPQSTPPMNDPPF